MLPTLRLALRGLAPMVGPGAVGGVALARAVGWFGSAPEVLVACAVLGSLAWALPSPGGRRGAQLGLVGILVLALARPLVHAVAPSNGLFQAGALVLGLGVWCAWAPWKVSPLGAPALSLLPLTAVVLGGAVAPDPLLAVALLALAGAPGRARARGAFPRHGVRAWVLPLGVAALGAGALAVLLVAGALVRTGVDPTTEGAWALGIGVGVAGLLPGARWRPVLAGLVLGGAAALADAPPEPAWAFLEEARPGWVLGALGFLGGAVVGRAPALAAWVAVAWLGATWMLPQAPAAWREAAALPRATLLGDGARAEALDVVHRAWVREAGALGFGAQGAVWSGTRGLLVELEGVPVDPTTRASRADRFAAVLGACLVDGRTRARVTGDALGLGLLALRAQGFAGVDASAPPAAMISALPRLVPGLGADLVAPGVRLLDVPGAALARLGGPSDLLVELLHVPWTDGWRTGVDPGAWRESRRTLAPGGAHVLALHTGALPPAQLQATLRAFADVYPGAWAWLPPAGADALVLVGAERAAPLAASRFDACAETRGAASLGLGDAQALRGLLLATGSGLRTLPDAPLPSRGLAPASPVAGPPPAASVPWPPLPADAFDSPLEDQAARHAALVRFLGMLAAAGRGEVPAALAEARSLASVPGAGTVLLPMVRPELERARRAVARALAEGPASPAWDEAESALTGARLIAPDLPETRCTEGYLARGRRQADRAEEAWRACLEGDPDSIEARLGLAGLRSARGDFRGAEALLREARERAPDQWLTARELGWFLYTRGEHAEAERWLTEAAAIAARTRQVTPLPHLGLARVYLATDRPALALAQAVRAAEVEPSAESVALRGAARFDLGQYELAQEDFEAALRLDPVHGPARVGLGMVQAQRGDLRAAVASFRRVLELDPANQAAATYLREVSTRLDGP